MEKMLLNIRVNGVDRQVLTYPNRTLLEVLRDDLGLTGAKEGCGTGDCGACTVILDGRAVNGCLVLAPEADGCRVETIEGLAVEGRLHPLQQAFVDHGALQCGFCTPGVIMAARALLETVPNPTRQEIRAAIAGNLCRCTGYVKIVDAIEAAAMGGER